MSEWQPISTAPKDGTDFLGWGVDYGMRTTYFADWWDDKFETGMRGMRCTFSLESADDATHWMPLPEPPK